jgi:predicted nucleic acid-binding protein
MPTSTRSGTVGKIRFRVPDALQLGAALEHGATLFITNDRHFERATELPVLILDDYVP